MSFSRKIKQLLSSSREKHTLTFTDEKDYKEKWSLKVSSFNLITLFIFYSILVVTITLLLIQYTPLKRLFTNENTYETEIQLKENTRQIDSLIQQIDDRQVYLDNLTILLSGEDFNDSIALMGGDLTEYTPNFDKNEDDAILRKKVEEEINQDKRIRTETESFEFFFSPVKGIVSQSFNESIGHYGVDVVTEQDAPIKSCLEGTVIFTGWNPGDGNILAIQHKSDLISIYKHCSSLLKKEGDEVQTGDPIGIVGTTGENSSGPHLHFELWKKGHLLDPEDHMTF